MNTIRTKIISTIVGVVMFMLTAPNSFATIIYQVDRTIGAGSVTGFVETDGTLGVLGSANFVDWNLMLNDGTSVFNLLGPSSGPNSNLLLSGSDLTASATDLFMDFSASSGTCVLFQNPSTGSGMNWYALETASTACGISGSFAGESVTTAGSPESGAQTGSQSWASTDVTTVPEPGTAVLIAMGFALMGLSRRKR